MNNTGKIVRAKTDSDFTVISNKLLQDCSMSFEEKGLLVFLLSLPNDWILFKSNLHEKTNQSKGTVDRVFKLLQDKGYIVSVKIIDKNTKLFKGWNHVVYEQPVNDEVRHQDLPTSGFADIGKSQPIQIHSITNTHIDKIKKENIKRKKVDFEPPTIDEVKRYFIENGYSPIKGEQAYNYYSSSNWIDKNNKPVLNWKLKMQLWFKPEDKIDVSKMAFEVENPEQYEGYNQWLHVDTKYTKSLDENKIWRYKAKPIGFK
jgi:hypothetical protein